MAEPDAHTDGWQAELKATKSRRGRAVILYELAVRHEAQGELDEAVERYRAALGQDFSFQPPLHALVRLRRTAGDSKGVAELHALLAKRAPSGEAAASARVDSAAEESRTRVTQARAILETALREIPGYPPAALLLEHLLRQAGDAKGAARTLAARIERTHDRVMKQLLVMETLLDVRTTQDVGSVLERLRTATSIPVERWRLLSGLVQLARAHGRTAELIEGLERMAELASARARGEAVGTGISAGSLPPFVDEAKARTYAAVLFWDAARLRGGPAREGSRNAEGKTPDLRDVLAGLDRALSLRPNDLVLRFERMETLAHIGDFVAAQREARGLIERAGEGAHAVVLHLRLAEFAGYAGNATTRRSALELALATDPRSTVATIALRKLLSELGEAGAQLDWMERRAEAQRGEAASRGYWEAAQCAADAGELDRSIALYQRATEAASESTPILRELHGAVFRGDRAKLLSILDSVLNERLDDSERGALLYDRYRGLAATDSSEETHTFLSSLLSDPPAWAGDTARVYAVEHGDLTLLESAQLALGHRATDDVGFAAHLGAAARAAALGGQHERAIQHLLACLERVPSDRYALALLEELSGQDTPDLAVALHRGGQAEPDEAIAELYLLRAAAVAERCGDTDLAAQAYRQATAQGRRSVAPLWLLWRLGTNRGNDALQLEALEGLRQFDASSSPAGKAAVGLGEYHDLVSKDLPAARHAFENALDDEKFGLAAAANLLVSPAGEPLRLHAFDRLLRDAHGTSAILLRQLRAAAVLAQAEDPSPDTQAALGQRSDFLAQLRALGFAGTHAEDRAAALRSLASHCSEEATRDEFLLYAHLVDTLRPGATTDPPDFAPESLAGAIVHGERSGNEPFTEIVTGLRARIPHASETAKPSLTAALGRALLSAGRAQEAVEVLGPVVADSPDDIASWISLRFAAQASGDTMVLAQACETLASRSPDPTLAAQLAEEAIHASTGDGPDLELRLRRALELNPNMPQAFERLAALLRQQENDGALLELLAERIRQVDDPDMLASLFAEEARLRRRVGDLSGALESLQNLLVLDPANAPGLALQARLLLEQEDWPGAVDALRGLSCVDLPAEERRSARWAAARYLSEKLSDPTAAFAELAVVERMGFADEGLLARMAMLAEEAQQYDDAVDVLGRAAELAPAERRASYEIRAAEIHLHSREDRDAAAQAFRRALEAEPENERAATGLALSLDRRARLRMATTFRLAVLERSGGAPTEAADLRKLRRSAQWSEDADLEFLALSVLEALDEETEDESARRAVLSASVDGIPATPIRKDQLQVLAVPGDRGPLRKVGSAIADVLAGEGRSLKALGLRRRDELSAPEEHPLGAYAHGVGACLGIDVNHFYEAQRTEPLLIVEQGVATAWILPPDPEPSARFAIAQQLLAARLGNPLGADSKSAERIQTVAAAAGRPLPGPAPDEDAVALRRKLLSRGQRKVVAALVDAVPANEDVESYCQAAYLTTLRGGLLFSSDLTTALGLALETGSSRVATELIRFWLTEDFRLLRRELGTDVQEPAASMLPVSNAAATERAGVFFEKVAAPAEWAVDAVALLQTMESALDEGTPTRERAEVPLRSSVVSDEGRIERRRMFEVFAAHATGQTRAELLLAAAELYRGEARAKHIELLELAQRADLDHLLALRRYRRELASQQRWGEVAQLLAREIGKGLTSAEQGYARMHLSVIQLHQLGDPPRASETVDDAAQSLRESVATTVVQGALYRQARRYDEASQALERAARLTTDPPVEAALLTEAAALKERTGDASRARFLYKKASELPPANVDALLGLARVARTQRNFDEASRATQAIAARIPEPRIADAFARVAGRTLHLAAGKPVQAVRVLEGATDWAALDALADAALAAKDPPTHQRALRRCADATRRTDRALNLIALAESYASAGKLGDAREALREAAHADQRLSIVRLLTKELARAEEDWRGLSRVALSEGLGPLVAAARLVGRDPDAERRFVADATSDETSSRIAATLEADSTSPDLLAASLQREVELRPNGEQSSMWLAISDLARRQEDARGELAALQAAHRHAKGSVVVSRNLAWVLLPSAPERAAALFSEEARRAPPERAAFAYTLAGRLLATGGADAQDALHRALEAVPGYLPALFALESSKTNGPATRKLLLEQAEAANSATAISERLVKAALLSEPPDLELLERAHEATPEDPGLSDLLLRAGAGRLSAHAMAELLEDQTAGAPAEWTRLLRLQQATLLEAAGDAAGAASACRAVLRHEDDPFADYLLDRLEPKANELDHSRTRLQAALERAGDDTSRALALERLATFELRHEPERAATHLEALLELFPGHLASLRRLERLMMTVGSPAEVFHVERRLGATTGARDAGAHIRLALTLLEGQPELGDEDSILRAAFDYCEGDPWLLRRVEASARHADDAKLLARVLVEIADQSEDPMERIAAELRAAEIVQETRSPGIAVSRLARLAAKAKDYPLALEAIAKLRVASGASPKAADAFREAARHAVSPRWKAELLSRAATIYRQDVGDLRRATAALVEAARADISYGDIVQQLAKLEPDAARSRTIGDLIQKRIAQGGDKEEMARLLLALAETCWRSKDLDGAKRALKKLQTVQPSLEHLQKLFRVCESASDWRGAAEALQRSTTLTDDPAVLRNVYLRLADVWERARDIRRAAEAAKQAAAVAPDDLAVRARLNAIQSQLR
ncbi:MAG: tetratricopeptide repeat protein [Myxococcota bacterium]